MAAEKFFTKVANEVLQSAEQISNRMEDGLSAILTGKIPDGRGGAGSGSAPPQDADMDFNGEDMLDDLDEDVQEILKSNPLRGMADDMLSGIMGSQQAPETFMEQLQAFRSAITWSEPFILCLLVFQLFMFSATIWVSRRDRGLVPRVVLMVIIAVVVRLAEYLNGLGEENWTKFATQNYFDQKGIFMMIFVCVPLLFDSLIMLICYLREASQLLVQVKTTQLKKQMKQRSKEAKNSEKASEKPKDQKSKKEQ